jgi:glucuronokinase
MQLIRTRAYARAGLLGNPSDGYFGKTIALPLANYWAEVVLYEWPELEIVLASQDRCSFNSIAELYDDVKLHGYYGGLRLVKATLKKFAEYCRRQGIVLHDRNFSVRYDSNIPRQVGLAGSSAIITATLRALMQFYQLSIPREIQPSLILSVETDELGISGGLQDRVCQVYETLVYMDFDRELIEKQGQGRYEPLDPALLPPLYLAYDTRLSEVSGVFHNNLRQRWDRGDAEVIQAMADFASYAEQGRAALLARDYERLATLMNRNFDRRRRLYELNPRHIQMVELARRLGASSKFAGSGGSVIGTYRDAAMYEALRRAFEAEGCRVIQPRLPGAAASTNAAGEGFR